MSTSSKNENKSGKIFIGYISSPHGIKGEVRVVPLTDHPGRFRKMDSLKLYSQEGTFVRTLQIRGVRKDEGRGELIVAGDVTDRDEAEALVGLSIMIDAEERVPLPEGEFWVDDLIGLTMRDSEGNILGEVIDFLSTGKNELYMVRDEKGGLHYIPVVEEFIRDIDLSSKSITVELTEGLWCG
jgi:16S rRNA processing protein RimM